MRFVQLHGGVEHGTCRFAPARIAILGVDESVDTSLNERHARPEEDRDNLSSSRGLRRPALAFPSLKNSIGCDDADIWLEHATFIAEHGIGFAYQHPEMSDSLSIIPPDGVSFVARVPTVRARFASLFVVHEGPGLLMELVSALLVWRVWTKHSAERAAGAFAAYGTSLALIAVCGFHCNTDCAYAGLTLAAFYLVRERRAYTLAGLALAAALNVRGSHADFALAAADVAMSISGVTYFASWRVFSAFASPCSHFY